MQRITLITIVFGLLLSINVSAQIKFHPLIHLPNDLDAKVNYSEPDRSSIRPGDLCAIIKVVHSDMDFSFDLGTMTVRKTVPHPELGELWVYVPVGTNRIKIYHPKYGSLDTEDHFYWFEGAMKCQSGQVYRLRLETSFITDSNDVVADDKHNQRVIFKVKPSTAKVYLRNMEFTVGSDGLFEQMIPIGKFHYRVSAEGYVDYEGFVETLAEEESQMVNVALKHRLNEKQTFSVGGVSFAMRLVPAGTFVMGDVNGFSSEKPAHSVTISNNFYLGETEVTQALWHAVLADSIVSKDTLWIQDCGIGDDYPAYNISYEDVQVFINRLNSITGQKFRLPTEAEWEYAAKGGNVSEHYTYSGGNTISDVAWNQKNSGFKTHPVKTKTPNELGIYDMSGNVWEWCSDWYGEYEDVEKKDPQGPTKGSTRVTRGGSWIYNPTYCRSAFRTHYPPSSRYRDLGVRLAL